MEYELPTKHEHVWILQGIRKSSSREEILAVSDDLIKLQGAADYYRVTHRSLSVTNIHVLK